MRIIPKALMDRLPDETIISRVAGAFCIASIAGYGCLTYMHNHVDYDPANPDHRETRIAAAPGCIERSVTKDAVSGLLDPVKTTAVSVAIDPVAFNRCIDEKLQEGLPLWEKYTKNGLLILLGLTFAYLQVQSRRAQDRREQAIQNLAPDKAPPSPA